MNENVEGKAPEARQEKLGDISESAKDQATGIYDQVAGQAQEQVALWSEVIRDQPLTSALVALGLGYILGRLTA
jgi:ElaB/YqjD/DUF883 family membrane-anchored ribosome-binding protein